MAAKNEGEGESASESEITRESKSARAGSRKREFPYLAQEVTLVHFVEDEVAVEKREAHPAEDGVGVLTPRRQIVTQPRNHRGVE